MNRRNEQIFSLFIGYYWQLFIPHSTYIHIIINWNSAFDSNLLYEIQIYISKLYIYLYIYSGKFNFGYPFTRVIL